VNVKDQLRAYLEQRREMGESEFVLDSMSIDEVMSIVGAVGKSPSQSPSQSPPQVLSQAPPMRPIATPPIVASSVPMASQAQRAQAGQSFVVGSGEGNLFGGPASDLNTLDDIAKTVATCTRCPLYKTATNPVPGEGNPNADFVVVGEAPGADEDATGRPFIGRAGQLLTKILAAVELSRDQVFICNVLKHRPPGNRNPAPNEVAACSPYLIRQLEIIKPKVILALGTFAAQTLLQTNTPIGKLRGTVHRYYGIPLVVTYHPAALLRNPAWKRPTWEDVQLARNILDGKV
jgi:uracil-DNA glycosylase family 4